MKLIFEDESKFPLRDNNGKFICDELWYGNPFKDYKVTVEVFEWNRRDVVLTCDFNDPDTNTPFINLTSIPDYVLDIGYRVIKEYTDGEEAIDQLRSSKHKHTFVAQFQEGCKDCKGTGRITLLNSEVECDCIKSIPTNDNKSDFGCHAKYFFQHIVPKNSRQSLRTCLDNFTSFLPNLTRKVFNYKGDCNLDRYYFVDRSICEINDGRGGNMWSQDGIMWREK